MGIKQKAVLYDSIILPALEKFPNLPILTLSRKIYQENPEVFANVDTVRAAIRYRKGKVGGRAKAAAQRSGRAAGFTKHGEEAANAGVPNPHYTIPESEAEEWPPYIMPKSASRVLVLSDIHIPYHDVEALKLAIKYGQDNDANAVLLNGDIMDCYQISRWEKDPRKRSFSGELEDTRQFLRWLKQEIPKAKIYFKLGNHEERYEKFLRIKAPELLDVSEFRLDVLLRFGELGIELIDEQRPIHLGKLIVMHGHEFGRSVFSPVNPARGYYMRAKANVLAGHNHQSSHHMEKNLKGDVISAWSTGCLSELHPAYSRINKWNLGFAWVDVNKDGTFEVNNMAIINGVVR